jgi:hypothetical protein
VSAHHFLFDLFHGGRRLGAADGVKTANALKRWIAKKIADDVTDADFARQLAAHWNHHSLRSTATTVELVVPERAAHVTHAALVHAIQGWLIEPDDLHLGVRMTLRERQDRTTGPFVVHDKRIARVGYVKKEVVLELDDQTVALPASTRTELRRAWQRGTCDCPACPRVHDELELSGFAAAIIDTFSASGFRVDPMLLSSGRLFLARTIDHRGVAFVENLEFAKRVPGLVVEASCTSACSHSEYAGSVEIATTTGARVAELRAWAPKAKRSIEAALARVTAKALRDGASAAREHAKIAALGNAWWTAKGKSLPDDAFKLGRVKGMIAIPARHAFEAYVRKTLRRAKDVCMTSAWRAVVLPRWAAR